MKVKCPRCRKPTEYDPKNPFRPFCSERCQTIDLGAWADEQYRVPIESEVPEPGEAPSSGDPGETASPAKHQLN